MTARGVRNPPPHVCRNASIGSIREARIAGYQPKNVADEAGERKHLLGDKEAEP